MRHRSFMVIAGEASGDLLAAELVMALKSAGVNGEPPSRDLQPLRAALAPRFFGAGGPRMAAAGVDLAFDLTQHSVIGLVEALKGYLNFRRLFHQLLRLALEREPDVIVCVDFSGFNRRFAHAIRNHVRARNGPFHAWSPRIVQYVSPQVWASRADRARQMAGDYDRLLTIFPFEKAWYANRVPGFSVEFIGHPIVDRYAGRQRGAARIVSETEPRVLLLPGSRPDEVRRHLPVIAGAIQLMLRDVPRLLARVVLPDHSLAAQAREIGLPELIEIRTGGLAEALEWADVAIASTGTVTMECAWFGVPTVAMYRTSWSTYQIGKRIITVPFLAMPNLLAKKGIFPEFIQHNATSENLADAALALLRDPHRRQGIQADLSEVVASLGAPGAAERAARSILSLLHPAQGQP